MLDLVQAVLTAVLLLLCFQGKGAHGVFIALWLLLPALRLAVCARYRERWRRRWREESERFRLGGIFRWIVLPTALLAMANGRSGALSSFDNVGTQMTAVALVSYGSLDVFPLTDEAKAGRKSCREGGDFSYGLRCTERGLFSSYPLALVVPAVPVYALARLFEGDYHSAEPQWRLAKWTAAWLGAWCVGIVFAMLVRVYGNRTALWTAAFLAVGSAVASTLTQGLWTHDGVVLGSLMALAFPVPWLGGLGIAWALASRLTALAFVAPFFLWLFWARPKRAAATLAWAAAFLLPWAWLYHALYGTPLGPQLSQGTLYAFSWAGLVAGTLGLLFSPSRGLLVYQPWLLCLAWVKKPLEREWVWITAAMGVLLFAIVAPWPQWHGGMSWGSRLLSEWVPFLALVAASGIDRMRPRVLLPVFVVSLLVHAVAVYGNGTAWKYGEDRWWLWTDAPFLKWL